MPAALERKLKRQAKKEGIKDEDAYVYGTLRKTGWKPKREKRKEKKFDAGMVPGDAPGSSAMLLAKLDNLIQFGIRSVIAKHPKLSAAGGAALAGYGGYGIGSEVVKQRVRRNVDDPMVHERIGLVNALEQGEKIRHPEYHYPEIYSGLRAQALLSKNPAKEKWIRKWGKDRAGSDAELISSPKRMSAKLDRLIKFGIGGFGEADEQLFKRMRQLGMGHQIPPPGVGWRSPLSTVSKEGHVTSNYVSAPSEQVRTRLPQVPIHTTDYSKLPFKVVSPDTLNIPPQPVMRNEERLSLLNRIQTIRKEAAKRAALQRVQRVMPTRHYPGRSEDVLQGLSAKLDKLIEFARGDQAIKAAFNVTGDVLKRTRNIVDIPPKGRGRLLASDLRYFRKQRQLAKRGERHNVNADLMVQEALHNYRAKPDKLIQFDTRPRNTMGEFTGASEGVPDPNTMAKTYPRVAVDAAVSGAAGAVGGGAAGVAGVGLKQLLDIVKKRKAKV